MSNDQKQSGHVPYWRVCVTVAVIAALCVVITSTFIHYIPPFETRRAAFTCNGCGNSRALQAKISWWRLRYVSCYDWNQYAIPADHEHRWWQFDGEVHRPFNSKAWSRVKYEDGSTVWQGQEAANKAAQSDKQLLIDQWIQ